MGGVNDAKKTFVNYIKYPRRRADQVLSSRAPRENSRLLFPTRLLQLRSPRLRRSRLAAAALAVAVCALALAAGTTTPAAAAHTLIMRTLLPGGGALLK